MTGGTGFVGAAVVEALHEAGANVRATYRTQARLGILQGLDVRAVKADIMDRAALRRAVRGCDTLFHVAGIVGSSPEDRVWEINALGPQIAVEAAAAEGLERVVLTSSVAGIGPSDGDEPATEAHLFRHAHLGLTYHNAKHEGEARALEAAARTGIELVIACPSYTLGAPAVRGIGIESSMRIVANYLRGRLPAVVDSWINVVDVDDAAVGHVLAWERGRAGERYIFGGEDVRWVDLLRSIGRIAGAERPFVVIPPELEPAARMAAAVRLPSPISPEAITLMSQPHRFSSEKARRELGYEPRDLDATLRRSVRWFVEELEAGRFSGPDLSMMRTLTVGVEAASTFGLLAAGRRVRAALGAGRGA